MEGGRYGSGWTTFFWAWWLSRSPFVGMFTAQISRGRTVRGLVGCMLVVPVVISAFWMNVFGITALSLYLEGGHTEVIEAAYRRTDLFERRRRLMGDWAAYLAVETRELEVTPIRRALSSVSYSLPEGSYPVATLASHVLALRSPRALTHCKPVGAGPSF